MIKPTTVIEQALYSTVRIEAEFSNGEDSTGTGFIFDFKLSVPGETKPFIIPCVVTNNHVVAGCERVRFRFHTSSSDGSEPTGEQRLFVDSKPEWIRHPDERTDLCAYMLGRAVISRGLVGPLFYRGFVEAFIWRDDKLEDLDAIEEVVMVGYPNGLWDSVHNYPLLRRGTTATHPAIDHCGVPEGIVDMAACPGSSGSPILIMNQGAYIQKSGVIGLGGRESRVVLLGVLHEWATLDIEGEMRRASVPVSAKKAPFVPSGLHLGYYIKAKQLLILGEAVKSAFIGDAEKLTAASSNLKQTTSR